MDNDRANESTEESVTTDKQFSPLVIEQKEEARDLYGHLRFLVDLPTKRNSKGEKTQLHSSESGSA